MREVASILLVVAACGGSKSSATDAAIDGAVGAGIDAAPPIAAPNEVWTWVPLDGMACGDGSATGVGVNLTDRSSRVMIYFQGGGACWDATTCFVTKSAVHIEGGYAQADFTTDIGQLSGSYLFQRVAANPFADASWIYVPYCTGDLHAGTRVATYNVSGTDHQVHHVGRLNAQALIARVAATRPAADTVWLFGISAGGYGIAFDFDLAHAAWPQAKVHALADSSPLVAMEPTRWAAEQASWAMPFPAGCTGCAASMSAMPAALHDDIPAGDRYALLADTMDATIMQYFGIAQNVLHDEIVAEQTAMHGTGNEAAFLLDGTTHVLLSNPAAKTTTGVVMSDWIATWASGVGWDNAGP